MIHSLITMGTEHGATYTIFKVQLCKCEVSRDTTGGVCGCFQQAIAHGGDPIAGYVQVDKGIVIHHLNCTNIQDHLENPELYIRMSWGKEIEEDLAISLIVSFVNERGAVSKIASSIGDTDYQVSNLDIIERGRVSRLRLNITVSSRIGLADVMRRIKSVRCVEKVIRETVTTK
jgi:guanosine-3',5'-bis(diphosphate) 3'-pyrophosphohydrolase